MKKTIVCIIIFLMAMSLCSCAMQAQTPAEPPTSATETDVSDTNDKKPTDLQSAATEIGMSDTDDKKPTDLQSAAAEKGAPDTESQSTSAEAQCFDLVGPWHLNQEKTDISAIEADMETFPGYAEWGAGINAQFGRFHRTTRTEYTVSYGTKI